MRRTISAIAAVVGVFAAYQAETLAARSIPPDLYQPKPDAECTLAPVDPSHLFIAASVMRGDTLTSVQLGDPTGDSTVVRVRVNEGTRPITVVLQAESPVIWDFEGLVWRVERAIVLSAGNRRVGVRGLPADRAEFPDLAGCRRAIAPPRNIPQAQGDKSIETYFGRVPDRAAFESKPNSLTLPQAAFAPSPRGMPHRGIVLMRKGEEETPVRGGPPPTFKEIQAKYLDGDRPSEADNDLLLYHPGGFRQLDAKTVVSPVPVLTPETFPGEAGLIQLMNAGAIRPARRVETDAFVEGISKPYRSKLSPDYRMSISFDYVVTRDVMLPPGLHGAHLKNFLVLDDVPPPRGNVGHGCLAFMDGFRMSEQGCAGGRRDLIEKLQKLSEPDRLEACRALRIPPGAAALEAVSTYRPDGARQSGGSAPIALPVNVQVRKPGAVLLVLNTYEPAVWRVSFGPETEIVGVILSGYYISSVEGVHPDTPILHTERKAGLERAVPPPQCAPLSDYVGAYSGGPAAMLFDFQIRALTGQNLDGLRGAYTLKDVEIR